jgi:lipopolysaccharide transport system ATP-binding protein
MKETAIWLKDVSKEYKIYPQPRARLLEWASLGFFSRHQRHAALSSVSMEVERGDFVGVIGRNGAGKTTLLKLLCGVTAPTNGTLGVNGTLLSLLELGAGYNPELTGRENILRSAIYYPVFEDRILNRVQSIEEFAELGDFFDRPVKLYSSGMLVRLAMSSFLCLEPEVLIVDEALSVGDVFFQQKCMARIDDLRGHGTTILLVTHDIELVWRKADWVILLDEGRVVYQGDKQTACTTYYALLNQAEKAPTGIVDVKSDISLVDNNLLASLPPTTSDGRGEIISLTVTERTGTPTMSVQMLDSLLFHFRARWDRALQRPVLAIPLKDRMDQVVSCILLDLTEEMQDRLVKITVEFSLQAGEYTFDISLSSRSGNSGEGCTEYRNVGVVTVLFDYDRQAAPFLGLCGLRTEVTY